MAERSALDVLIEDAAGSEVPVDELLRRLKVVASRARIPELEGWVQMELDGYEDANLLPPYRGPFSAHVLGHFSGMFQSQARNVPIAPTAFPKEYREGRLFEVRFFDGVAELEVLAAANSELTIPWPADALMLVQMLVQKGELNLNGNVLNEAHQVVSRSTVVGILRTVRDRVLALALRLEEENPYLGETGVRVDNPAVARDLQIIVNGGSPNIAIGSSDFVQTVNVAAGDLQTLMDQLERLGIPEEQLDELRTAIEEDATDPDDSQRPGPGRRVMGWLGKLTLKASDAAGSELARQAGDAVGGFFG